MKIIFYIVISVIGFILFSKGLIYCARIKNIKQEFDRIQRCETLVYNLDVKKFYSYGRLRIEELPKITFKSFKTFFELNPDAWQCEDFYVYRKSSNEPCSTDGFTFTNVFEIIKYKRYIEEYKSNRDKLLKEKAENKLEIERNERLEKLLKVVQEDINNIQSGVISDMKNCEQKAKEINSRLNNGDIEIIYHNWV